MSVSDAIRHWLMGIIAGKRFAFWISDKAHSGIQELSSVAGGGAAIVLVGLAKQNGWTEVEFTLDGYVVTVRAAE